MAEEKRRVAPPFDRRSFRSPAVAAPLETRTLLATVALTDDADTVRLALSGSTVQIFVDNTTPTPTQTVPVGSFTALEFDGGDSSAGNTVDHVSIDLPGVSFAYDDADSANVALDVAKGSIRFASSAQLDSLTAEANASVLVQAGADVALAGAQLDGVYAQSGGSFRVAGQLNGANGYPQHASISVTGGTLSANDVTFGSGGGGATMSQSGGSMSFGTFRLGWYSSGDSAMTQTGGNFSATDFYLGYWATATWTMSHGATLTSAGEHIGCWGNSTFTNNGGTNSGGIELGSFGGTAVYNQSAGSTTGDCWIGRTNGNGTVNLSGGSFTSTGTVILGAWSDNAWGTGRIGTFNQSGGAATFNGLILGYTGGNGVYNLSAGTLSTHELTLGYAQWGVNEGQATFNQAGGTQHVQILNHDFSWDGGNYGPPIPHLFHVAGGGLHTQAYYEQVELDEGTWTTGSLDNLTNIDDQTAVTGTPLTINTAFTNANPDATYGTSVITWGDSRLGSVSIGGDPDDTLTATATHVYTAAGLYHVLLKVNDPDGGFAEAAFDVDVVQNLTLTATANQTTRVNHLAWVAASDHDSYRIYRGTSADHLTLYDQTYGGAVSYDDHACSANVRYYYQVVALSDDEAAIGAPSNVAYAELTGSLTGNVSKIGGGVGVRAVVTADNHYELLYGNAAATDLTWVGRNETGDGGSKGFNNWNDAEAFNFRMPKDDYLYVTAWDAGGYVAMTMGQFTFFNGQQLLTNPTDWRYDVIAPNYGHNGNGPATDTLSGWIASATAASWHTPAFSSLNGTDWTIPEITGDAHAIWTTSNQNDFDSFVVFRAKLPASVQVAAGTSGPLPGITVYDDANQNGKPDTGETTTTTDSSGNFELPPPPVGGTAYVREVVPSGWAQISPANPTFIPVNAQTFGSGYTGEYTGADFIQMPLNDVTGFNTPPEIQSIQQQPQSDGKSVQLKAIATDDYDIADLAYTWTLLTPLRPGSAPVTFTPNPSRGATTTVTFLHAGTYVFRVTAVDAFSESDVKPVTVTVASNFDDGAVAVLPATLNLPLSTSSTTETHRFFATGIDQFGDRVTAPVLWTVANGTPGSIDANGIYTAPTDATVGSHAFISATYVDNEQSSDTAWATITFTPAGSGPTDLPPTIAIAATASPAIVTGNSTTLHVRGADDGGEENLRYTWLLVGTAPADVYFEGTADSNEGKDTTARFLAPGVYHFIAEITDSGLLSVDSDVVTVTVVSTPTSISITPQNAHIAQGSTLNATMTTLDQFGTSLSQGSGSVSWSITGDGNSVNASGEVSGGIQTGQYLLSAVSGTLTDSTSLTIDPMSDAVRALVRSTSLVDLSWPAYENSEFRIYRSTGSSITHNSASTLVGDVEDTFWADGTVAPNTNYIYQIYAENASGEVFVGQSRADIPLHDSDLAFNQTAYQSGLPPSAVTSEPTPAPVTQVRAIGINGCELLVTWKNVADDRNNTHRFAVHLMDDLGNASDLGFADPGSTAFIVRGAGLQTTEFLNWRKDYRVAVISTGENVNIKSDAAWSNWTSPQPPDSEVSGLDHNVTVFLGGNSQPMKYLLTNVEINPDLKHVSGGYSVARLWTHAINMGYDAFLSSDPHDGGDDKETDANDALKPIVKQGVLLPDGSGRLSAELLHEFGSEYEYNGTTLSLVGYSHGGGMAANLADYLAPLVPYTDPPVKLVFVGLIDAVKYGSDPSSGYYHPEPLDVSPSRLWEGTKIVNYYETKGFKYSGMLGLVHGQDMVDPNALPPSNINLSLGADAATIDHSTIATNAGVLFGIESQMDDVLTIGMYG